MAVPQNRVTRSRRNMRRAHDALVDTLACLKIFRGLVDLGRVVL